MTMRWISEVPPRSGPRGARGTAVRPAARACSPGRRGSGRRGRPPGRPSRSRPASPRRPVSWSSRRGSAPRAACHPTRYSSDLAAMTSAAMSASMNSMPWCSAIGAPNCTRSPANAVDSSSARSTRRPSARRSSAAPRRTSPSSARTPARPRRAPVVADPDVLEREDGCSNTNVCMYFGGAPADAGRSLSTRNTVGFAGSPSTWAWTRKKSATSPDVTCHFSPARTQPSPSRRPSSGPSSGPTRRPPR